MLEDQWTAEVKRLNALCDDTLKTIRYTVFVLPAVVV